MFAVYSPISTLCFADLCQPTISSSHARDVTRISRHRFKQCPMIGSSRPAHSVSKPVDIFVRRSSAAEFLTNTPACGYPVGLEMGGHTEQPDWPKLGPSLLIAAGMILAIRSAKSPATHD